MYKITKTYVDFNGVERTEDNYFNLNKEELMEMEMGTTGGYIDMINKIIAANDKASLFAIFKSLVLKSYGEKSIDGKYFLKSDEIRHKFSCTQVYADIFTELATDTEKAIEFVNGIIPANLKEEVDKELATSN